MVLYKWGLTVYGFASVNGWQPVTLASMVRLLQKVEKYSDADWFQMQHSVLFYLISSWMGEKQDKATQEHLYEE